MNDTIIIIPIRLKASRFPNKPFAKIGDLPMLHYIYKRVSDITDNLLLAICDQEVREYCEQMKLKFIMTDPNHMSGTDRIGEAVRKLEEMKKFKFVINVHGCFWHHHGCPLSSIPKTREDYWLEKFEQNKRRDFLNKQKLKKLGWRVFEVWECSLTKRNFDKTIKIVERRLLAA